jgi:hypothetical protein
MLAAIPSVILGFWGCCPGPFVQSTIEPFLHDLRLHPDLRRPRPPGSHLTASLILTIMMSRSSPRSRVTFHGGPQTPGRGIALGATRWEARRRPTEHRLGRAAPHPRPAAPSARRSRSRGDRRRRRNRVCSDRRHLAADRASVPRALSELHKSALFCGVILLGSACPTDAQWIGRRFATGGGEVSGEIPD